MRSSGSDRIQDKPMLEELWTLVRKVPPGRVASYGAVGRALRNPASGFQVGRWMAQCPEGVPWWRIVAQTGQLPVGKRDPFLASEQALRLQREGATITDGIVAPDCFWDEW